MRGYMASFRYLLWNTGMRGLGRNNNELTYNSTIT